MLNFLEILTGIKGVIPDPYYVGGGLHQIKPGGNLEVHADFNLHTKLKLDRRINVLVYMNKDWHEEYGGHFELWNKDMTAAEQKILPLFNRCAIFSTTSTSYHGHPTPLSCPPDRTRKSIATYYYSNGRPEEEANESHSTLFMQRPGAAAIEEKHAMSFKDMVKAVTPPIVVSAVKSLRK
jgi:Rps23 Pro-64 3,4-dihydroxylase Tpa1-like proline 4-hydroxylase